MKRAISWKKKHTCMCSSPCTGCGGSHVACHTAADDLQPGPERGRMEPGVHPLALNGRGAPARICQLHGSEEQRRFLGTLGFAPGCEVRVMNELAGDLIVEVKGTRVALGRQLAHKVMVV